MMRLDGGDTHSSMPTTPMKYSSSSICSYKVWSFIKTAMINQFYEIKGAPTRTLTDRLHQSTQRVQVVEALEVLRLCENVDHPLEVFLTGASISPRVQ